MAKVKCSEFAMTLMRITTNLASRGNVKNLSDAHAEIKKLFPTVTREMLSDAITEATTGNNRRVDEIASVLNEIKREARFTTKSNVQIKEYEQHLREGTLPITRANERIVNEPTQAVKDLLADLRKQLARSEPAIKQRIERRIATIERKLEEGDILPKTRDTAEPQTLEVQKLDLREDELKGELAAMRQELRPRSLVGKIFWEGMGLSRTFITTLDVITGRQGVGALLSHPIMTLAAQGPALKGTFNKLSGKEIMDRVWGDDITPFAYRSDLALTHYGDNVKSAQREEVVFSRLARNIPVVKRYIEANERNATVWANVARLEYFKLGIDWVTGGTGKATAADGKFVAHLVNVFTGRGSLPDIVERGSEMLNKSLFSTRLNAGRVQLLTLQPIWAGKWRGPEAVSLRARAWAAGQYGRFLGGAASVLALGMAAGGTVETDETSADYLKLKFGNHRLDVLGGLPSFVVLASRIWEGRSTSATTGIATHFRGPNAKYGARDAFDIMSDFARGKLAPAIAIPIDIVSTKNIVGEPTTPGSVATGMTIPLYLQDVYDSLREDDYGHIAALSLLSLLGMGLQTFKATDKQKSNILYEATAGRPEREPGESLEKFDKRRERHEVNVVANLTALRRVGLTSDPDLAEQLLRDEIKKRGGSWESISARISRLRRALREEK